MKVGGYPHHIRGCNMELMIGVNHHLFCKVRMQTANINFMSGKEKTHSDKKTSANIKHIR